jgi:hypothetical protein
MVLPVTLALHSIDPAGRSGARRGDDTDQRRVERFRWRESFEGQEQRRGDLRFATRRNTVNPRIGSRAKQTCTIEEEQAAEVVQNHRAARGKGGSPSPGSNGNGRSGKADSPI